jgi:hypothetical protein
LLLIANEFPDYAIVVLGVVLLVSTVYWFVRGRKRFAHHHVLSGEEDATTITDSVHVAEK